MSTTAKTGTKATANKKKWNAASDEVTEVIAEAIAEHPAPDTKLADLIADARPEPDYNMVDSLAQVKPRVPLPTATRSDGIPHVEINGELLEPAGTLGTLSAMLITEQQKEDFGLHPYQFGTLFGEANVALKLYLFRYKPSEKGREKVIIASPGSVFITKPSPTEDDQIYFNDDDDFYAAPISIRGNGKADVLMLLESRAENVTFMGVNEVLNYPLISNSTLQNAHCKVLSSEKRRYYYDHGLRNRHYVRGKIGPACVLKGVHVTDSTIISSTVKGVRVCRNSTIMDSTLRTNNGGLIKGSTLVETTLHADRLEIIGARLALTIDSGFRVLISSTTVNDFHLWAAKQPITITNRFAHGSFSWVDEDPITYYGTEKGIQLRLPYSITRYTPPSQGSEKFIPFLNYEDEIRDFIGEIAAKHSEKVGSDLAEIELSLYRHLRDQIVSRMGVLIEVNRTIELSRNLCPQIQDDAPF